MTHIAVDKAKLAEFCRRHHIRKLSLFGSVLRAALKGVATPEVTRP